MAITAIGFGAKWGSYTLLWMTGKLTSRDYSKKVLVSFIESAAGLLGSWAGLAVGGIAQSGPIAAVMSCLFGLGGSWAFKKGAEKLVDSDFAKPLFDWIEEHLNGQGGNSMFSPD